MVLRVFIVVSLLFIGTNSGAQTDPGLIERQLTTIVNRPGYRTWKDTSTLHAVARYIESEFRLATDNVRRQSFNIEFQTYWNVVALVGDTTKPRIVIGAHYDVCEEQHGADDNGSGVVGLIQALHQLKNYSGDYCLEFVAYTLEEPPFFSSNYMGSAVHARSLKERGVEVRGMVSLEMIGYFSDEKDSQSYPLKFLKLFYGNKGDYITLVRRMNKGGFTRSFCRKYKRADKVKTKLFTGPRSLPGIDFSDHRNYWNEGYDALMITDTAFYRNKNYHKTTDTVQTLDFVRMAKVIDAFVEAINSLK